ncbi:hypothetical protein ACI65C_013058 [Semiaphis heraclei]
MLSQSLRVLSVRDQASICPFALREVSVLAELALGHLRYFLTDVPPQSNSPPGGVLGIRIAPGPGPAETPRTRTATFDGRPHAHGRGPRFDARSPRLVLNATGISTAARHERAQADGAATAPRTGRAPDEPTANRRRDGTTADGRTHPRPEPRVPLYRRLLTSETCCGYRYEPTRRLRVALSRIFKVRVGVTDTAATSGALRARVPIARLEDSRDVQRSQRKENSSRTPRRLLRVHSGRPDETKEPRTLGSGSASGSGIRTGFPLAPWAIRKRLRPWYEDLSPGLGSTDSWTTAVHKKPFSTAAPEGPSRVFATTTKICTDGGSRRSRDLPFDAHRRAILLVGACRDRPPRATTGPTMPPTAEYRHDAPAPSIFRASCFGRSPLTRAHVRLLGPCFKTGRKVARNSSPTDGTPPATGPRRRFLPSGEPTRSTGVRREQSRRGATAATNRHPGPSAGAQRVATSANRAKDPAGGKTDREFARRGLAGSVRLHPNGFTFL